MQRISKYGDIQYNNNNNNRSFNMVKTSAQPYKHIIHAYAYNHIQMYVWRVW